MSTTFDLDTLFLGAGAYKTAASVAVHTATWTRSVVRVDEDEVDLLAVHDTGVQNALALHDQAIRALIATHDADIKKELAEINRKLDEQKAILDDIKRLLLTPQGIREGFPIKRQGTRSPGVRRDRSSRAPPTRPRTPSPSPEPRSPF